jgi:lycopene cyclase domain-containing protein
VTYSQFLLIFLVCPLAVVVVTGRSWLHSGHFVLLGIISVIAVIYTGPWDSAIIANGVWSYGTHQVAGILVGHVPLEEYGFYVLQTLLVGSIAAIFLARERPE